MRGTTCCEQDASLAIIRRALRFERIVANADVATTTYSYDANGNLVQAGGWNYVWDYLNRMLASGFNNSTTTYAYDPSGARVLQTSTTSATYYPNKYYSFTSTKVGANTYATSTNYIWNGDTLLATIDQPMFNGTATGSPIARYIHPDHLGSTNAVTDQNGSLVQLLDYYPYGATRISTSTYPTNEKRQYIGQFTDQSNLSYLNARYMEPSRGQFLSQDPVFLALGTRGSEAISRRQLPEILADPQGMNAYSYARNNPLLYKDDRGKYAHIVFGAIAGDVIGVGTLFVNDVRTEHTSSVSEYVGAGINGAIAGAAYAAGGGGGLAYQSAVGAVGGAVGAGVGYGATQGIDYFAGGQSTFSSRDLFGQMGSGFAYGAIPGIPLPGINTGVGFSSAAKGVFTKYDNGLIRNISPTTFGKAFVAQSVDQGTGALVQSVMSVVGNNSSGGSGGGGSNTGALISLYSQLVSVLQSYVKALQK